MKKSIYLIITSLCLNFSFAQVLDVQYQTLNFGANKVNKIGNGQSNGNIVLFQNVITVGGQSIDAIVTTVNVTNVSTFDNYDDNGTDAPFFSPKLTFGTNGGSILVNFQFILNGTYNNSSNTGQNIELKNFYVNTYDIDGNGSGTNQYNEFQLFASYELGNPTNLEVLPNVAQQLTKFRSTTNTNNNTTLSPLSRVRLNYSVPVSNINIKIGAEGSGLASFYLDFSAGPNFSTSVSVSSPSVVITPSTLSSFTTCSGTASSTQTFTVSGTNLTNNVVVTAPTGYEVSLNNASGFGSTATITASGTLNATNVYVRMAATATGNPTGNITIASTGTADQTIAISGNATAAPSAGTLSGTQSICVGNTTTFSSTISGGTWTSTNTALATVNTSGVITGVATGTATITYTVTGTGGCADATATRTVTINALPSAPTVSSPQLACPGNTVADLQATAGSGETIQWFSAATGGSPLTSTTSLISGTTYYAQAINANGCTSSKRTALTSIFNNTLHWEASN